MTMFARGCVRLAGPKALSANSSPNSTLDRFNASADAASAVSTAANVGAAGGGVE